EKMKSKKFVRLAWPQRHWDVDEHGKIYLLDTLMEMIPAAPGPDLGFVSPHMDVTYEYLGDGLYELFVTGRDFPAVGHISISGHVTFQSPAFYDSDLDEYVPQNVEYPMSPLRHTVAGVIWVVDPQVAGIVTPDPDAPNSIVLANGSPDTYSRLMTEIMTSLSPAGYQPTSASIQLWQDGSPIVDRPLLGGGRAWLENGVPINIKKEYSLVYV